MLRLAREGKDIKVVADQITAPTYTADLAAALYHVGASRRYGTYHVSSGGQCSWHEFAGAIFALAGVEAKLSPTTAAAFGAKAPRPAYSVLDNEGLAAIGAPPMRQWRAALADYLMQKGHIATSK
jgi:dTDP-4-dehydrorhamnose reductase